MADERNWTEEPARGPCCENCTSLAESDNATCGDILVEYSELTGVTYYERCECKCEVNMAACQAMDSLLSDPEVDTTELWNNEELTEE
jgi:hypothetical protein|tara:strand:+ start:928 stop:1191 length:264 start_codon:yes stop_codon:yes gene_type:complete